MDAIKCDIRNTMLQLLLSAIFVLIYEGLQTNFDCYYCKKIEILDSLVVLINTYITVITPQSFTSEL